MDITEDGKQLMVTLSESCDDVNSFALLSLEKFDPSNPTACWDKDILKCKVFFF